MSMDKAFVYDPETGQFMRCEGCVIVKFHEDCDDSDDERIRKTLEHCAADQDNIVTMECPEDVRERSWFGDKAIRVAVTLEHFPNEEEGEEGHVEVLARFATIKEAEDFLSRPEIDQIWLAAGHYGIDAPEEMVNP